MYIVQEHTAQPNPGTRGGSPGGKSLPIVNTYPPPAPLALVLVIMLPKDVFQLFPPSLPRCLLFNNSTSRWLHHQLCSLADVSSMLLQVSKRCELSVRSYCCCCCCFSRWCLWCREDKSHQPLPSQFYSLEHFLLTTTTNQCLFKNKNKLPANNNNQTLSFQQQKKLPAKNNKSFHLFWGQGAVITYTIQLPF